MKILYIIDQKIESGKTAGIIYKIRDKLNLWKTSNFHVEVLSLYDFRTYDSDLNLIDESNAFNIAKHGRYYTLIRLILSTIKLKKLKVDTYDLIYMRQRLYVPLFRNCFKNVPVIVELNTNDVEEYKIMPKVLQFYNCLTRSIFYKKSAAFLAITFELASRFDKFNKKTCVIANGVCSSKFDYVESISNDRAKIVFVGSPGFPWHGLDKIKYLASKLVEFDFHIFGVKGDESKNLFYHGYMKLDELKKNTKDADVAISTMSLHVKNMDEASPLKSRQYLAQGLPIIYAYDDTDLSGAEEFALKIPNTQDNVILKRDEIKSFILKCKGNSELRIQAREFAEKNLDVKVKEKIRLEFIQRVYQDYKESHA